MRCQRIFESEREALEKFSLSQSVKLQVKFSGK